MKAIRAAAALLIPLAVVACSQQGGEQAAMEGEQAADQQMAAATGQEAPAATEVELSAKNDSGITGTATLTARGDSLAVDLSLSGLTEGDSYAAHLHEGTCEAGGGVVVGLAAVTGQADGTGSSTKSIARSAMAPGQSYFIQAHQPDGTPAACGDVPAMEGAAGTDTASGSSM